MYNFVRIILIWLFCLLSVLLHELGHALGYRISGGKAGWKVVVGSGPRLISISRFTFGLIPAGGNFVPAEEPETDKGQIIMLAGGPFLSLLQAILYWITYFCISESVQFGSNLSEILLPVSTFLLYFNFFQFLFTAIPMRYRVICRGFESDGLQIRRCATENNATIFTSLDTVRVLLDVLEETTLTISTIDA